MQCLLLVYGGFEQDDFALFFPNFRNKLVVAKCNYIKFERCNKLTL